ncbi:MAG: SagB/ThcOx family dehydrogenase [Lachnospiraceae bacterium]|nr:SagB/ThcOx family dehydrogenase [Lachnospiraceae bacterium]
MNDKTKYEILRRREMMKGYTAADVGAEETDQQQKLPYPAPLKAAKGSKRIPLPLDFEEIVSGKNLFVLLQERESCRKYKDAELSLKELSFLLWAAQGVRRYAGKQKQVTFRNVPSAGSRHPFETYLFIRRVEGMKKGIYHYLPAAHELEVWEENEEYEQELTEALCGQKFAAEAPVTFVWSVIPYRTEWRYGLKAQKYALIDAGHVCENLYLACEAVGCGTCAIGAYDQELLDELLGFAPGPSSEAGYEFALYAAPVGKKDS